MSDLSAHASRKTATKSALLEARIAYEHQSNADDL
jgi:hypothetical protein